MTNLGKVKNGMMVNLIPNNKKLKERLIRIKSCQKEVLKLKLYALLLLDVLEVQTGDYFSEDDIIRLEDKYFR